MFMPSGGVGVCVLEIGDPTLLGGAAALRGVAG